MEANLSTAQKAENMDAVEGLPPGRGPGACSAEALAGRIPAWLNDAVVYQVYPQSYYDSNADGIGDFNGLTQKLDYIKALGVSAVWLNPVFESPFGDAGYDVSDYYKIAPRYGSMEDFTRFCVGAADRGIKVILDLVAGHTSIEHPWFKASARKAPNEYSNRYIWRHRDYADEDAPPRGSYVKNFFWCQPALNYGYARPGEGWQDAVDAEGPRANRAELKAIMRFWMERGAAGFRVDMASSLVKDDDRLRTANRRLWRGIREWFESGYPDGVLIAEWGFPMLAVDAGFHMDFMLHTMESYRRLAFNAQGTFKQNLPCYFDRAGAGDINIFLSEYLAHQQAVKGNGYIALPTANHDFQRPCCGGRDVRDLRAMYAFFFTWPGVPILYYGDEIGMRFLDVPGKEGSTLHSADGAFYGERAGSRTPMQWDWTENAGFSTAPGPKIYLPIDPDSNRPTVSDQEDDPDSLLNFTRRLIALRKRHRALQADGSLEILHREQGGYPFVYKRAFDDESFVIALNPAGRETRAEFEYDGKDVECILGEGVFERKSAKTAGLIMPPVSFAVFKSDSR